MGIETSQTNRCPVDENNRGLGHLDSYEPAVNEESSRHSLTLGSGRSIRCPRTCAAHVHDSIKVFFAVDADVLIQGSLLTMQYCHIRASKTRLFRVGRVQRVPEASCVRLCHGVLLEVK